MRIVIDLNVARNNVVSLAQTGKIRMLVGHFPLERAAEGLRHLHDGKIQGRAVITPNN